MSKQNVEMRILLVELGPSHDEVLLSWYRDLHAMGANVHVACPEHVWHRLKITTAQGWVDAYAAGGLPRRLLMILRVRRYIKRNRITHVVLNSASGTTQRDFSTMVPDSCTFIGTLHDASKMAVSSNQKVITRNVDSYAVLAPYLLDLKPPDFPKPVRVITATAGEPHARTLAAQPLTGPLRVVIAGGINWKRRDYDNLFTEQSFARLGKSVRFVLAGGADPEDQDRLQRMLDIAPEGVLEVHDGYIPHDTYAHLVATADIVLPLTHPACEDYPFYIRSRISGAMSIAWAYAKPLMLERGFQRHASLNGSIFYDVEDLVELLVTYANDRALLLPFATTPPFATDEFRQGMIAEALGIENFSSQPELQ